MAVRYGKTPAAIKSSECNAMSKDDMTAVPGLLVAASRAGDPLASYAIMTFSNYLYGESYVRQFLQDPNLLAVFKDETLAAQRYFEPLGTASLLNNIADTFHKGTVLPQDPVMDAAYQMAGYTVYAQKTPESKLVGILTMPFGVDSLMATMTTEQRNTALYNAQAILNRCCNGVQLAPVLIQRKG